MGCGIQIRPSAMSAPSGPGREPKSSADRLIAKAETRASNWSSPWDALKRAQRSPRSPNPSRNPSRALRLRLLPTMNAEEMRSGVGKAMEAAG